MACFVCPRLLSFTLQESAKVPSGNKLGASNLLLLPSPPPLHVGLVGALVGPVPGRRFCTTASGTPPYFYGGQMRLPSGQREPRSARQRYEIMEWLLDPSLVSFIRSLSVRCTFITASGSASSSQLDWQQRLAVAMRTSPVQFLALCWLLHVVDLTAMVALLPPSLLLFFFQ